MGNDNAKQAKAANNDAHNQVRSNEHGHQKLEEYPTASTNYKYKDVRMPYRTEVLEMSEVLSVKFLSNLRSIFVN